MGPGSPVAGVGSPVGLSRREWLRSIGGLAAAACGGRVGGRRIEGSILGPSRQRGHLLRQGAHPLPGRDVEVPVLIVGGGMAGLSAAWAFARAGFQDWRLLELEDEPGGTSRGGENAVSPYPWGAHYVPAPDPANRPLVALLDELGAIEGRGARGRPVWSEAVLCRDPAERLFLHGEWMEGLYPRLGASRADLAELERFEREMRALAARADARGRRLFSVPRFAGGEDGATRALDDRSMADWLAREGYRSARLLWLIDYSCRDEYGARPARTSAWAGIQYFASRLDLETGEPAPFLTWPEGNARIVRHLQAVAGGRLETGWIATEARPRGERVEVIALQAATGEATRLRAEQVVVALPRYAAARVVRDAGGGWPLDSRAWEYAPWVVANLTLSDRPASRGHPLAWDNVIHASDSLGYVTATHQPGRDHGPTVLTWFLPLCEGEARSIRARLETTGWEEWAGRAIRDLSRAHPGIERLVERVDVVLWGHGMVRPRPGFVWSEELLAARRPLGRIHFAHTDLSGYALLEEALYHGVRAAEEVLCARGLGYRSWLE